MSFWDEHLDPHPRYRARSGWGVEGGSCQKGGPRGLQFKRSGQRAVSKPARNLQLRISLAPSWASNLSIGDHHDALAKPDIISIMSKLYTGQGDDGFTSLLGEGRVPKYHERPQAYGAVDEASAALGLARAHAQSRKAAEVTEIVQRGLYQLMAELASTPENAAHFRSLNLENVTWLEAQVDSFGEKVTIPEDFVLGGDSIAGAAYDLARTVVRRAERQVAQLYHAGQVENPAILPYLNRLSSLCFVLSLWENQRAGIDRPSLAKPSTT